MPSDVTWATPCYDAATREFRRAPRPGVHQPAARRRDQPRVRQDAVGAARGDAGGQVTIEGEASRSARRSCARDAEPDRDRGHLSAARGAARPLPAQDARRLPERSRRRRDVSARHADQARRRPATWPASQALSTSRRCSSCRRTVARLVVSMTRCATTPCASDARRARGPASRWAPARAAASRWCAGARAAALLDGRGFVTPDDVKARGIAGPAPSRGARARARSWKAAMSTIC
jgi:hypothetical protein